MAVLDATDLQYIAKEQYGCSSTVWHVAPTGNDSTGNGLSWIAPWATPNKAATVAAAGDVIVVSGAITANSIINLQAGGSGQGISLVAAMGAPRPVLTFNATSGYVRPGNRSIVRGIRLVGSVNTLGGFQYPIGNRGDDGASGASDVLIDDVEISCDSDGIYNTDTTNDRWTIRGCKFYTKYDAIVSGTGSNWIVEDNDFIITGPSVAVPDQNTTACQLNGTGHIVRRNRFTCSGSTTGNRAIVLGTSAAAIVSDNRFLCSGTSPYDIVAGTSAVAYDEGNNAGSSTGGVLLTSGAGTLTRRQPASTLGSYGLDYVMPESGYNVRQILALMLAGLSGECDVTNNGGGSFTFVYKAPDDSTARVTITASTISKERTAVTLNAPV